jgi:hypothetical protein
VNEDEKRDLSIHKAIPVGRREYDSTIAGRGKVPRVERSSHNDPGVMRAIVDFIKWFRNQDVPKK